MWVEKLKDSPHSPSSALPSFYIFPLVVAHFPERTLSRKRRRDKQIQDTFLATVLLRFSICPSRSDLQKRASIAWSERNNSIFIYHIIYVVTCYGVDKHGREVTTTAKKPLAAKCLRPLRLNPSWQQLHARTDHATVASASKKMTEN